MTTINCLIILVSVLGGVGVGGRCLARKKKKLVYVGLLVMLVVTELNSASTYTGVSEVYRSSLFCFSVMVIGHVYSHVSSSGRNRRRTVVISVDQSQCFVEPVWTSLFCGASVDL